MDAIEAVMNENEMRCWNYVQLYKKTKKRKEKKNKGWKAGELYMDITYGWNITRCWDYVQLEIMR